jgi:galactoside O-acetyltransferase
VTYYGEREKDTFLAYLIPQGGHSAKDWSNVHHAPIVIRDKAWIGFGAIVLKGVTIGEGAVVGAGSVVTKDVPDWTVVGGNPAQVLYSISPEQR